MAMEFLQPHNKEMVLQAMVDAEEAVEEALIGRRARSTADNDGGAVDGDDLSSSDEEHVNNDKPNNNVNFDWTGGIEDLAANLKTDIHKVLNGVVNSDHETGNPKEEILSGVCLPSSLGGQNSLNETGNAKGEILSGVCLPPSLGHDSQSSASVRKGIENERITEEEVVELEFFDTAAVDKLHTHNAYCPNCSSRITKVVLRRVKRERRISIETADPHDQKLDLLGCFSCFSVFVRIGKKLNPFPIFGSGGTNNTGIAREPNPSNTNSVSSGSATVGGKPVANEGDDCRIPIEDPRASPSTVNSSSTRRPVLSVEDSKSLEIVKCIVYGGLIESITSLSVVASAAASDADTMKIVTLGVANLIGGLFVICQNLVDLRYRVGGGSNFRDQVDQYGELLGQRKHFLIHFAFALLSYFVFGLIPPVVYGSTFRKSNDKDYKLIAVAAASLLCIIILATAKAYTLRANKFSKYFKTILSYVVAAGMASGVGYAAGHLIKRLMDDLGWFDSKPAPSLFSPEMISQNSAWASY